MSGIVWTDVWAQLPQPVQAHDAAHGRREARARLWYTQAQDKPYRIEIELRENGALVETWANEYSSYSVGHAHRQYSSARFKVTLWMEGFPLAKVRPQQFQRIKPGAP